MLGKKSKDQEEVADQRPRTGGGTRIGGSVISKEMRIDGDCIVEGRIRIEGHISGNVRAGALELGESGTIDGDLTVTDTPEDRAFVIAGKVDGSVDAPKVDVTGSGSVLQGITADEANVEGRVEGGIVARKRLVLEATAWVEGDVRARRLALKEGGQVNGTMIMGDHATPSQESLFDGLDAADDGLAEEELATPSAKAS